MTYGKQLFGMLLATSSMVAFGATANAQAAGAPAPADEVTEADIIVTGLRASVESARNIKRNADTIVDSIVAEDIGKFPDQNVVESLSRIPGVQIGRREGEGADISIRGLSNVKTVLNGRELFGGTGRSFSLGDLPSEVLGGIDVYKTSTAAHIEGGLGGYVDVRTRRPFDFDGFSLSLSAKGTYYDRVRGFDSKARPSISGLISNRWETGIGEIGALLNVSYGKTSLTQDRQTVDSIATRSNFAGSGQDVTMPNFVFLNGTQNGSHERFTVVGSLQWKPSDSLSFYADAYYVKYTRKVVFSDLRLTMGAETSDYSLFPGTTDLQRGVFTNTQVDSATAYADQFRTTQQYAVGGEWDNGGPFTVKWDVSHTDSSSKATLEEWDMRTFIPSLDFAIDKRGEMTALVSGVDLSSAASYKPVYDLSILQGGKQRSTSATLDASYAFEGIVKSIDAGFRYNDYVPKNHGYVVFYCANDTFAGPNPCGGGSLTSADIPSNFIQTYPSTAGDFVAWNVDAMRQFTDMRTFFGLPTTEADRPAMYLRNQERTSAFYAKLNFDIPLGGLSFDGNIGGRFVHTKYTSDSFGTSPATPDVYDVPQHTSSSRNDFLPTFNGRLKLGDGTSLRVAVGKSLERVPFADLNGAIIITNAAQFQARRGNPDLQPFTSWNFDASLEHYFSGSGLIYLAGFHKEVDGYLQDATLYDQTLPGLSGTWTVFSKENAAKAKIDGAEVGAQAFFDFLPEPFDGLGAQANYTYVKTKLDGLPSHSYNLIGMYEKGPISARVAYGWRGKVVSNSSRGRVSQPVGVLDASISYNVNDHLSLSIDAGNLLGYKDRGYYSYRDTLPTGNVLTDRRFGFQVRYKL